MFLIYLGIYILFGVGYVIPRTTWGVDETWKKATWSSLKVACIMWTWFFVAVAEFVGLIEFREEE